MQVDRNPTAEQPAVAEALAQVADSTESCPGQFHSIPGLAIRQRLRRAFGRQLP